MKEWAYLVPMMEYRTSQGFMEFTLLSMDFWKNKGGMGDKVFSGKIFDLRTKQQEVRGADRIT